MRRDSLSHDKMNLNEGALCGDWSRTVALGNGSFRAMKQARKYLDSL